MRTPRRAKMTHDAVAFFACLLLAASAWGAEPVSSGQLVGFQQILVPPVDKIDVTKLVDAGTIETDGFKDMVVNLGGEWKEAPSLKGVVGALLVPDMPPFDKVLSFHNVVPVPLEIKAPGTMDTFPFFMAKQVRFEVGFPRYRILLYNTTGATATVAIFIYRTN